MDPLERFEFSQSSLQDFVDCRRRFQLRYLQRVAWPAIQAEPARENERRIQRGERFHRLAQQYLLGVPEDKLTRMAMADEDENLLRWWQNFLDFIPASLASADRFVEVALEARLDRFRLVAQYDLVLLRSDGRAIIYDWKTSTSRPSRQWLLERLQTRVYPYLLALAGGALNHQRPVEPDQVEMVYWFAEPGLEPERLAYTHDRFQEDERHLLELVNQVASLAPDDFVSPDGSQSCGYCVYRSLCNRGVQAGSLAEAGDLFDGSDDQDGFDFGLEQVGEISF